MKAQTITLTLLLACFAVAGCHQTPKLVITEYEKTTLSEFERVTYNDDANEELASVVQGVMAYDTFKDGQSEIYVKSVTGRQETRKTTSSAKDFAPSLSRDGERLAFVSNRSGPLCIYLVNAKQASAQTMIGEGTNPVFSADPDVLFYQRFLTAENASSLWRYDFKTSQHSLLGAGFHPAPSPDGKLLAFCKFNPATGNDGIWVLNLANGQEMELLTMKDTGVAHPVWSPDGQYLLFTTNRGGLGHKQSPTELATLNNPQLGVVKADGTGFTLLTDNETSNVGRAWGDDGYIYFSAYRMKSQDIWRFKPRMN